MNRWTDPLHPPHLSRRIVVRSVVANDDLDLHAEVGKVQSQETCQHFANGTFLLVRWNEHGQAHFQRT